MPDPGLEHALSVFAHDVFYETRAGNKVPLSST